MKRALLLCSVAFGSVVWLACDYVTPNPFAADVDAYFSSTAHPGPGGCPHGFSFVFDQAGADVDRNGDCAACAKQLRNGSTVTIDNNVGGPSTPGAYCSTKKP